MSYCLRKRRRTVVYLMFKHHVTFCGTGDQSVTVWSLKPTGPRSSGTIPSEADASSGGS